MRLPGPPDGLRAILGVLPLRLEGQPGLLLEPLRESIQADGAGPRSPSARATGRARTAYSTPLSRAAPAAGRCSARVPA